MQTERSLNILENPKKHYWRRWPGDKPGRKNKVRWFRRKKGK